MEHMWDKGCRLTKSVMDVSPGDSPETKMDAVALSREAAAMMGRSRVTIMTMSASTWVLAPVGHAVNPLLSQNNLEEGTSDRD